MLVANAFDLWQKDPFFSAAEEVQESADILESAYRSWLREKKEGIAPDDLAELGRELQIALGTAKWQLEEFERAINLSYGNYHDENRISRHRQFIVAIASQISCVEHELREALSEGKLPFRWVNLDEAERDDLALFISGDAGVSECVKEEHVKPLVSSVRDNLCFSAAKNGSVAEASSQATRVNDGVAISVDRISAVELNGSGTWDNVNGVGDRSISARRTFTSPNLKALQVIIPNEEEQRLIAMPSVQSSPKEKGSRMPSSICGFSVKNWSDQIFGRSNGFHNIVQRPRHLHLTCSVRLTFVLMLVIFLFVPFALHSV